MEFFSLNLSLVLQASSASAHRFHFTGRADKSSARVADKRVPFFGGGGWFCVSCPPCSGMCAALALCMAGYLSASQFLPLSQLLAVRPPVSPGHTAQVFERHSTPLSAPEACQQRRRRGRGGGGCQECLGTSWSSSQENNNHILLKCNQKVRSCVFSHSINAPISASHPSLSPCNSITVYQRNASSSFIQRTQKGGGGRCDADVTGLT